MCIYLLTDGISFEVHISHGEKIDRRQTHGVPPSLQWRNQCVELAACTCHRYSHYITNHTTQLKAEEYTSKTSDVLSIT
jgi:hypothetical protein